MKNSNSLGRVVDSSSLVCLTDPCWISHPLSLLADPDISDNTKSADINSHNSQMCHYSSSSSSSFQYLRILALSIFRSAFGNAYLLMKNYVVKR